MGTTHIKIFVTRGGKIRANISGTAIGLPTEMTLGGESWKAGKLKELHPAILRQAGAFVNWVNVNLKRAEKGIDQVDIEPLQILYEKAVLEKWELMAENEELRAKLDSRGKDPDGNCLHERTDNFRGRVTCKDCGEEF